MPKVCCVPTCKLRSDDLDGLNKTFHTFPADKALRDKWEQQLKAKFVDLSLTKYSYVCSSHFKADYFYFSGLCKNLRLKKGSYPSIFSSLEHNKLEKQFVEADRRSNDNNLQLTEAVDSEQVDICTNEALDSQSKDLQTESDGERDTSPSMGVPELVAAEISTKADGSESNNASDKMIQSSKSRVKSVINLDVESLDVSKDVKDILRNARAQIISLRRKNKTLRTKLYRWKKGVKTGNSLLSHLKHRKFINENVVDSLKVSTGKVIIDFSSIE